MGGGIYRPTRGQSGAQAHERDSEWHSVLTSCITSAGMLTMSSRERSLRRRPPVGFFCAAVDFFFVEVSLTSLAPADRLTFFAGMTSNYSEREVITSNGGGRGEEKSRKGLARFEWCLNELRDESKETFGSCYGSNRDCTMHIILSHSDTVRDASVT